MRHGKKINHLGRTAAHRKAMLANMACSLIEHKRINTTVAKAKALKQFIEPLITKSKTANNPTSEKGMHNRRVVFSNLRNKHAVTELFGAVADKVGDRPGGYTRIIKLGNRLGDNADMAMIELVDFNELYTAGDTKKAKTRRSRRGKSKKVAEVSEATETLTAEAATPAEAAPVAEEVVEVEAETVAEPVAESTDEVASEAAEEVVAEAEAESQEEPTAEADDTTETGEAEPSEADGETESPDEK